ncbi:anti-sigma factor [Methylobacterium sp. ID0610]|uniref:anti-sigma factor n=1 Tax=Methylobacterium carpenticola TaxID=3344827 RepID=UPI0036934450
MSASDDPDLRAAEYVLGTLDAAERAAFERDRAADPALAAAQAAWEARLAPLVEALPQASPSPSVWVALRDALPARQRDPAAADSAALRRWRRIGLGASALAAGLALFVAVDMLAPRRPAARYLAVAGRDGERPALVVTIDARAGTVQVRALAVEVPRGRSLELWFVAPGNAPRSLGLVADAPRTRLMLPADHAGIEGATLAVTVEPPGGSPSGSPTGPIVYRGELVRD